MIEEEENIIESLNTYWIENCEKEDFKTTAGPLLAKFLINMPKKFKPVLKNEGKIIPVIRTLVVLELADKITRKDSYEVLRRMWLKDASV